MASTGGKLTEAYLGIWELDLWEIIEAIEAIAELNKDPDEVDLGALLDA